jgi:hypothetical protein
MFHQAMERGHGCGSGRMMPVLVPAYRWPLPKTSALTVHALGAADGN